MTRQCIVDVSYVSRNEVVVKLWTTEEAKAETK